MITYPAAYIAENEKLKNTPATIVEIVTDGIEDVTTPNDQLDINGSPASSLASGVGHADTTLAFLSSRTSAKFARQSFILPTFRSANITNVNLWFRQLGAGLEADFITLNVQFFLDEALTVAITGQKGVNYFVASSASTDNINFSFSGEEFNFVDTETYYLKVTATQFPGPSNPGTVYLIGAAAGGYADGELYSEDSDSIVGDSDFTFSLGTLFDNYTTPTVHTYDLDIGETPVDSGEWTIKDTTEDGSSVTYTAVSDDNASFTTPTALGTIVDGDAITTLERYYRVTATLVTTIPHNTPTVLQIKAVFEVILTISDTAFFGHLPDLQNVSTITKTIDDFKASTIGQISFTTAYSADIRDFIETKFPKGNTVRFKRGFVADSFTLNDFVDHYVGRIENWVINGNDTVSFKLNDFQRDLSTKIPVIGTDGATTDIEYTAQHPVTVMLDIIQNRVGIRTSKVDVASFDAVVTALSGWTVTRNVANNNSLIDPVEAQKLLEELRVITSTYFIPQNDGKIVLKQWDSTETPVRTFLERDFHNPPLSADANLPALFNFVLIYYDWDGSGNNPSDFGSGSGSVDATSLANWGLTEIKQLKDKWTLAAQTTQIETVRDNLQNRYKDPPQLVSVTVDSNNSDLEVGDVVTIQHSRLSRIGAEDWVDSTFSIPMITDVYGGHLYVVGQTIYYAGGEEAGNTDTTDAIFSADINGLSDWVLESGVLSDPLSEGAFLQVGDTLYIFGGNLGDPNFGTDNIYSAPVSDPTNWSDTGFNLPAALHHSSIYTDGTTIYLFGGRDFVTWKDVIYSAPVSDPTNWSDTGFSLPDTLTESTLITTGGMIYLFGGRTGASTITDTIYSASILDPTDWSDTGFNLHTPIFASGSSIVGDYIYLFGGNENGIEASIYRATLENPVVWFKTDKEIVVPLDFLTLKIIGESIYIFGGRGLSAVPDPKIYKSEIKTNEIDFQIVSVNPASRDKINLKLLGMGV